MKIPLQLGENSYTITLARGALARAGELFSLGRRVLIVTDDGVPASYARTLAAQCASPTVVTVPAGEGAKSLAQYEALLTKMLEAGFTRRDCVLAVGGGRHLRKQGRARPFAGKRARFCGRERVLHRYGQNALFHLPQKRHRS